MGAVSIQTGSSPRTTEVVDAGPGREAVVLHRLLGRDEHARPTASEIWLATAAVTRPPSTSGLRLFILSMSGSRRGPSSTATSPSGAISRLEAALVDGLDGAAVALEGEGLHVLAGDVPLLGDHLGRAELADLLVAVALDPARRLGERVGEAELLADEHRRARSGSALMFCTPPATTRSLVPLMTAWAAKCTACCDEPHWRSMVVPGTSSGRPAASQQVRAMSPACGPMVSTQPKMTSSTARGIDAGAVERAP